MESYEEEGRIPDTEFYHQYVGYQEMDVWELHAYFSWRTGFRRGESVPYCYEFMRLHAAELIAEQQKTDVLAVEKVKLSKERDQLTAQLADAEKMAEYQAEQRQQAQRELMDLKTQAARGDAAPVEDLTAESVGLAVRTFITSVGYLPHSDKLTAMRYQDRQQVQAFARMIGKWAADVQSTLENVNEAIVIMEG